MIDLISIAILFSLHQISIRKGVEYGDANYGAFVSLLTTSLIFVSLSYNRIFLNMRFLIFMILAGILHFLVARTAFYNAISRIGANSAGSISATRVFFAVTFGFAMGEEIGIRIILMAVLIFAGVYIISMPKGANDIKGVSLALLTGFMAALSSAVVKSGMEIHPDPIFGSAIGYLASASLFPIFFKYRKKGGEKYFIPAGFFVGFGHYMRYRALISYPISVVEPILSTYPLFTILLTAITLRRLEKFSRNIIIGSILIVAGVESYYLL